MSNTNTATQYHGLVTGTISNGTSGITYNGQIKDQWSGDVLPPNDTTFWSLGSCTKSFTATLLGQSVQAGTTTANSLVWPIVAPLFPAGTQPPAALMTITLEQLATMTSGLPGDNFSGGSIQNPIGNITNFLNALLQADNYDSNLDFDYSDMGYGLLSFAMVACNVNPLPQPANVPAALQGLFTSNIFTPLGMSTAGFYPPAQQSGYYLPYGYLVNGNRVDGNKSSWPAEDGAGALYMTAPDLMTWLQSNMNGTIPGGTNFVQSNPVSTMQTTGETWPEGQYITRGWFTNSFTGPVSGKPITMVTKNGDIPGFHCGIGFQQPAAPGGASAYGVFAAGNYEFETIPLLEKQLDILINGQG